MRSYLVVSAIAIANVALGLLFFSAGFFVRGWVDRQQPVPVSARAATPQADIRVANVSPDDDPARGPKNPLVTVIEFSDFQCPFCRAFAEQSLPRLLNRFGDQLRFVYRDFPIAKIHPAAANAAQAAQCAFEQGRFWEYHDRLFQHQEALDVRDLKRYARAVGLNVPAFDRCLGSGRFKSEVQKDLEDGRRYGVSGTPTFFINGRKVVGALPTTMFEQIIEEELVRAKTQ